MFKRHKPAASAQPTPPIRAAGVTPDEIVASIEMILGPEYSARVEVAAVAIDEFLGGAIPQLDFLHMDIEGAEPLAMQGAKALIARSPNLRIVTEWGVHMMRTVADVPAHISWLDGEGFRFWRIGGSAGLEAVNVSELINLPLCDLFVSRQDPPAL